MTINFGRERGDIDSQGNLKVLLKNEGIWIKVIARHKNKKKVIGTLANEPFGVPNYKFGDIVLAEEKNSKEIAHITRKMSNIPNTQDWQVLHTTFGGVF